MRIILLSNNDNIGSLYEWLTDIGNDVNVCHDPIQIETVNIIKPDLVISYNYRHIVKEDVIDRMGDRIINLHISYLPWNKGASPNIWSFIDDTPKGVTIHRLEKGLDTGKIIFQKEMFFDENSETLATTYKALNDEIVRLLTDNWKKIASSEYELRDQKGKGSYHRSSDLEKLLNGKQIDYSMTIKEFMDYIDKCRLNEKEENSYG